MMRICAIVPLGKKKKHRKKIFKKLHKRVID